MAASSSVWWLAGLALVAGAWALVPGPADGPDMDACMAALSPTAPAPPADAASATKTQPTQNWGLVSGPPGSERAEMANDIVAVGKARGPQLANWHATGSMNAVARLRVWGAWQEMAIGIVRADVVKAMNPGEQMLWRTDRLRPLLPLGQEHVHVLAQAGVRSLADLKARPVVAENSTEDDFHTATLLLRAAKVVPVGGKVQAVPSARALCEVVTGSAAAVVLVAAKPAPALQRLDALRERWPQAMARLHLVPTTVPGTDPEPVHLAATLTAQDYPQWGLTAPVATLAVQSLLVAYQLPMAGVANPDKQCSDLDALVNDLKASGQRLRQPPHQPAWRRVDMRQPMPGWDAKPCWEPANGAP